ncbi:MAG: class I SAM-dependent methyltransferase [Bacteroidales bacterium]
MAKQATKSVRTYYNEHVKEEDARLTSHPFELWVTLHFVDKYLDPGSKLFDVACGTGRIAQQLLQGGFVLGLNDLSEKNIELVTKRLQGNRNVLFIKNDDALKADGWERMQWDGILLLGPLYHMISKENRVKVLNLACQNVKPGGYVFSSFMTRTGAMVYGVKNNPQGIRYQEGAEMLWETGTDERFVEGTEWFVNAYFSHPEEINPQIEKAGLEPLHLAGVEGIFGERIELYHQLEENLKKPWREFIIRHCEDIHMINQSKHLLSVARKPK